jgi:two-component system OmpR family response regulator
MSNRISPDGRSRPWTTRRVALDGAITRVLIVDDNANGALALAAYLTLEGMQCRTAFGGREAILVGTAWTPHVILMDISMPECNGFDAARVLRQEPRTDSIAIVAHTALDEPEVRRKATADEFDGYVQKGRPPGELITLIRMLAF